MDLEDIGFEGSQASGVPDKSIFDGFLWRPSPKGDEKINKWRAIPTSLESRQEGAVSV